MPQGDEASLDSTFEAFRTQLQAAVARRDRKFLLDAISPEIKVDFAGEGGRKAFIEHWKLDSPGTTVWKELAALLRLGAARTGDQFVAPYLFQRFPGDVDEFSHVVVIRAEAPLRAAARPDASVIAKLSSEIVKLVSEERGAWWHVRTESGKTGWLSREDARSPLDYRAFFEKRNGRWLITTLVAGD